MGETITINGVPADQWQEEARIWQDACRTVLLDPAMFDLNRLIPMLCNETWMLQCEIIPDYMPPFPREDTKPTCVVRWCDPRKPEVERDDYRYLRYSNGPLQGTFWDVYGDDFHTPELALVMLSRSQPPPTCVFNFHHSVRTF